MHPLPHHYRVTATASQNGDIPVTSAGLPPLATAAPIEFDGPGGRWSPEELLVAAVADCFALTFRGIARASKFEWTHLRCDVTGTLERIDRVTQFTRIDLTAHVQIPDAAHEDQARRIAIKAEETCLITRSLKAGVFLEVNVAMAAAAVAR